MSCANSEDSDPSAHLRRLIKVFAVRSTDSSGYVNYYGNRRKSERVRRLIYVISVCTWRGLFSYVTSNLMFTLVFICITKESKQFKKYNRVIFRVYHRIIIKLCSEPFYETINIVNQHYR